MRLTLGVVDNAINELSPSGLVMDVMFDDKKES
jgi:hypothetical protein